jgi:hypothetical protein
MKTERDLVTELLARARAEPGDFSWVGPLSRAVSRRLSAVDLSTLRAMRAQLAATRAEVEGASESLDGGGYASGVLRALTEVTAAASAAIAGERERQRTRAAAQPLRRRVLELLASDEVMSPSEMVASLESDKFQIARALGDLLEQTLVEQASMRVTEDGRTRRYRVTDRGRAAIRGEPEPMKTASRLMKRAGLKIAAARKRRAVTTSPEELPSPEAPDFVVLMPTGARRERIEEAIRRAASVGAHPAFIAAGHHTVIGMTGEVRRLRSRLAEIGAEELIATESSIQ